MKRKKTSKYKKHHHRKPRNTPRLKKTNKKTRKYFVGKGPGKGFLPKIDQKQSNGNFVPLFGIEPNNKPPEPTPPNTPPKKVKQYSNFLPIINSNIKKDLTAATNQETKLPRFTLKQQRSEKYVVQDKQPDEQRLPPIVSNGLKTFNKRKPDIPLPRTNSKVSTIQEPEGVGSDVDDYNSNFSGTNYKSSDAISSDAISSDAIRSDAIRSDAISSDAIRSDAIRSDKIPDNRSKGIPTRSEPITAFQSLPPPSTQKLRRIFSVNTQVNNVNNTRITTQNPKTSPSPLDKQALPPILAKKSKGVNNPNTEKLVNQVDTGKPNNITENPVKVEPEPNPEPVQVNDIHLFALNLIKPTPKTPLKEEDTETQMDLTPPPELSVKNKPTDSDKEQLSNINRNTKSDKNKEQKVNIGEQKVNIGKQKVNSKRVLVINREVPIEKIIHEPTAKSSLQQPYDARKKETADAETNTEPNQNSFGVQINGRSIEGAQTSPREGVQTSAQASPRGDFPTVRGVEIPHAYAFATAVSDTGDYADDVPMAYTDGEDPDAQIIRDILNMPQSDDRRPYDSPHIPSINRYPPITGENPLSPAPTEDQSSYRLPITNPNTTDNRMGNGAARLTYSPAGIYPPPSNQRPVIQVPPLDLNSLGQGQNNIPTSIDRSLPTGSSSIPYSIRHIAEDSQRGIPASPLNPNQPPAVISQRMTPTIGQPSTELDIHAYSVSGIPTAYDVQRFNPDDFHDVIINASPRTQRNGNSEYDNRPISDRPISGHNRIPDTADAGVGTDRPYISPQITFTDENANRTDENANPIGENGNRTDGSHSSRNNSSVIPSARGTNTTEPGHTNNNNNNNNNDNDNNTPSITNVEVVPEVPQRLEPQRLGHVLSNTAQQPYETTPSITNVEVVSGTTTDNTMKLHVSLYGNTKNISKENLLQKLKNNVEVNKFIRDFNQYHPSKDVYNYIIVHTETEANKASTWGKDPLITKRSGGYNSYSKKTGSTRTRKQSKRVYSRRVKLNKKYYSSTSKRKTKIVKRTRRRKSYSAK